MEEIHNPGTLLKISGYFWKTCTLHAGVKLDIFSIIGDERLNAEEVARRAGTDCDGTKRLLNALVAMKLLEHESTRYKNTRASARFLVKSSEQYIGYMIMHHHNLVESWNRLDRCVASGKPVRSSVSSSCDPAEREAFLMGMYNNASLAGPDLVRQVDLGGRSKLLDLGGGPGTYAVLFCRQNPDLLAWVLDLPTTRRFAENVISKAGMSDRIRFLDGNYVKEELTGSYDVVWMSHILHAESPDVCRRIIKKAHGVLEPNGMLLIHEFILDDDGTGPLFPALFSLNMLLGTNGGRSYTQRELFSMLKDAGFSEITRLPYTGPAESGIISAVKRM